jgi:lipopolysaccharide assembly outer membrane protein LptD (OstA)
LLSNLKIILTLTVILLTLISFSGSEGKNVETFYALQTDSVTNSVNKADSARPDSVKALKIKKNDDLKSKVIYSARDSIRFDVESKTVFLYGDAEIKYENIHLKAARIEINWDTHLISARGAADSAGVHAGTPVFSEGDQKFKAREIRYNFESKKGKISSIVTQEGESYILGETVKKDQDNNFYVKGGAYTTCNLDTPHFYISASRLKVIQNNKIISGPAYLVIEEVPTPLVVPFGFFPNKKGQSSGILIPTVGESAFYGFSLENGGYYFALSDYANLALRGNIYSKGSYNLNAASQYKLKYRFEGNVDLGYSVFRTGESGAPDFTQQKNFFVRWVHNQDPKSNPYTRFSANVNLGSSQYFKNTINTSATDYLTNNFASAVSVIKTWPGKPYSFSAALRQSQNTQNRSMELSLPEMAFNVARLYPFRSEESAGNKWYDQIGISYSAKATNNLRTSDTAVFNTELLSRFQNGVQHSIPINTSFKLLKYFSLAPSFNYNERWYLQSRVKRWDDIRDTLLIDTLQGFTAARDYDFNAALSTRLYGLYQTKTRISAIRHVITPTMGLNFRPDFSSSVWNYYSEVQVDSSGRREKYSRFEGSVYGGPPPGESATLSFALDNNIEMKYKTRSDTGAVVRKIKIFESLNFASGYNFIADSLPLRPFSVSGRTTVLNKYILYIAGVIDPYAASTTGRSINKLEWNTNRRLGRLTNANLTLNFNLNSAANKQKTLPGGKKEDDQELADINKRMNEYVDFSVPWNISIAYSFNYFNSYNQELDEDRRSQVIQTINLSGDLNLTPKWKVRFTTNYDIEKKDISYTSLNIHRDLHCWEMSLGWVPFGIRENYNFRINVKSPILQALELLKRNPPPLR